MVYFVPPQAVARISAELTPMRPPVVAIVGAPNVGKSTLFNRLVGRRQAIVSPRPGVTRDRITAACDLFGTSITLVDTGGVVTGEVDDLTRRVRLEAAKAVEQADLILLVSDGRAGLTGLDRDVAVMLRESGKPIIPVANKVDAASLEAHGYELWDLGLGPPELVSAEQGRGIDSLVDRIRAALPPPAPAPAQVGVPTAIVGRPNVGKSSLFNRIVKEERVLVSPTPGTTRDPIDVTFKHHGVDYRIIDTAGIRRRAHRDEEVEWVSVLKARQALEQAAFAVAIVDGSAGIEHQDLAIIGLVVQRRIPAVLAVNKSDLVAAQGTKIDARLAEIKAGLPFCPHLPVAAISALTGEGVDRLLETIHRVREESGRRFATADLNRALEELVREKQPPADRGRAVRFYYMTQTGDTPPRFVVFSNGLLVRPPYRRYMEGRLRTRLGLTSSPLQLSFRRSRAR
jgi:GTP-binding protein